MAEEPGVAADDGPAEQGATGPGTPYPAGGPESVADRAITCHQLLLRLAGRAPDALLTACRDWLADGRLGDLARALAFWAAAQDVVLADREAALLLDLLETEAADLTGVAQLRVDDHADYFTPYGFGPVIPSVFESATGAKDLALLARERVDQEAATAAAQLAGVIGLWRAWRFPADVAPWPPPRRVFTAEVTPGTDQAGAAATLARQLAATGEPDPQVEVYQTGDELPAYQEFARAYGELLWSAAPDPGIRVAAVFDEADPDERPRFLPDHPQATGEEAERIAAYLEGGQPLLVTGGRMDDVVDASRTSCVPISFRTDGTWIWNDASAYYVREHGLAPEAGLLEHLRALNYQVPPVDGVAIFRALAVLQEPAEPDPDGEAEVIGASGTRS
jgi:hypothetical protein